MPPTITPAGQKAKTSIANARSMVNAGATPSDARRALRSPMATSATASQVQSTPRTGFAVPIPPSVPAEALNNNVLTRDVLAARDSREQTDMATAQLGQDYDALFGRIGNTQSPLVNPEQTINRLLLSRPTDTQTALDTTRANQAETTRGFMNQYEEAGTQAREDFGVADLQTSLADTRTRIADRTTQLRQTIRDFETNAERRGVAREFVEAEKRKVQADAAAELADLAIIESAQLGNLNEARTEIDRVLNEKMTAFEFENKAIEQEITRLEAMDTREADARKEQLSIALDERKRLIEEQLANEKSVREYMVEAASNGADTATLDAIRNAKTPGEAALMAGPWIGKIEREAKKADIAQQWAGLKLREDELALARDRFESESTIFGSGTVTTPDGQKAVITSDGTVTPISQIDFNNPEQVDALPVGDLTKAVMNGFAKTKDLTPTQKGQVISELQNIGFNPNTYVVNKLNSLVETWAALPEDSRGYVQGLKFWESKTRPEVATFESQKQLLTREIARLFDVGVLSDQDVAAYKDAMPSRQDDSIDVVISKTAGIAGAAAGTNPQNAGKRVKIGDGREAIVATDGDTLLDPKTGKPIE